MAHAQWKGPSTKEMIETHTLASNIMEHQYGPTPIFDDAELMKLRRFTNEPEKARDLLEEYGLRDGDGDAPGTNAESKGSLAGYIIARHDTTTSVFTDDEIIALRDWFGRGK